MAIRYTDEKVMGRPAIRELLTKAIEQIENMRKIKEN